MKSANKFQLVSFPGTGGKIGITYSSMLESKPVLKNFAD